MFSREEINPSHVSPVVHSLQSRASDFAVLAKGAKTLLPIPLSGVNYEKKAKIQAYYAQASDETAPVIFIQMHANSELESQGDDCDQLKNAINQLRAEFPGHRHRCILLGDMNQDTLKSVYDKVNNSYKTECNEQAIKTVLDAVKSANTCVRDVFLPEIILEKMRVAINLFQNQQPGKGGDLKHDSKVVGYEIDLTEHSPEEIAAIHEELLARLRLKSLTLPQQPPVPFQFSDNKSGTDHPPVLFSFEGFNVLARGEQPTVGQKAANRDISTIFKDTTPEEVEAAILAQRNASLVLLDLIEREFIKRQLIEPLKVDAEAEGNEAEAKETEAEEKATEVEASERKRTDVLNDADLVKFIKHIEKTFQKYIQSQAGKNRTDSDSACYFARALVTPILLEWVSSPEFQFANGFLVNDINRVNLFVDAVIANTRLRYKEGKLEKLSFLGAVAEQTNAQANAGFSVALGTDGKPMSSSDLQKRVVQHITGCYRKDMAFVCFMGEASSPKVIVPIEGNVGDHGEGDPDDGQIFVYINTAESMACYKVRDIIGNVVTSNESLDPTFMEVYCADPRRMLDAYRTLGERYLKELTKAKTIREASKPQAFINTLEDALSRCAGEIHDAKRGLCEEVAVSPEEIHDAKRVAGERPVLMRAQSFFGGNHLQSTYEQSTADEKEEGQCESAMAVDAPSTSPF